MERTEQPASWDESEIHHLKLADVARPLRAATDAIRQQLGFMALPKALPTGSCEGPLTTPRSRTYIAPGLTSGTLLLVRNSSDDAPSCITLPEFNHSEVTDRALDLRTALELEPDPFGPNGWAGSHLTHSESGCGTPLSRGCWTLPKEPRESG